MESTVAADARRRALNMSFVPLDGEEHLLVFGLEGLSGHDLATGTEHWFTPWANTFKNGSVMPLVVDGEVLLSVFSNGAKKIAPRRISA